MVVRELHHVFRLRGEQLALRRDASVQLRSRALHFSLFQRVHFASARRHFQIAVLDWNVSFVSSVPRVWLAVSSSSTSTVP